MIKHYQHALLLITCFLFSYSHFTFAETAVYSNSTGSEDEQSLHAQCDTPAPKVHAETPRLVDELEISSQPIFDESDPNAIWLHRVANRFHVITRPWVIEERLSFSPGQTVDEQDLREAEALLRNERYLRDARIRFSTPCDAEGPQVVRIETWDNWSLIPSLSFSRSGGENKTRIGVQQDNLFGMGIRTRLRYNKDEQRSGYQLTFSSAVPWTRHANLSLNLLDNDDGKQMQVVFDQPFYHLRTKRMRYAELAQGESVEDIFQNGETRNSFNVDQHQLELAYGWQVFSNDEVSNRISVGYSDQQALFTTNLNSPSANPLFLPIDREYQFPWIAYEHVQRNIIVMQDIYLIQQPEDINLGWHFRTQFGIELNDVSPEHEVGYHLFFDAEKATQFGDGLVMFQFGARAVLNARVNDFLRSDARLEYFYKMSDKVSLYSRLSGTISQNAFLDDPVVLDDDTGVRGYPNQYQHGDHRMSASLEARYYTGYNFYQLFDVGFATFFDAGRAFGGDYEVFNESNDTLASVGIGARLFSNRSSNRGVVHIDFATPLTDGESIDSWEWRLTMRNSF